MTQVAGVATKAILNKVISLIAEEMSLAWGFKADLKRLSERLKTAQALLSDVEDRKLVRVEAVQQWLKKLKAAACDADDVLDEFAFEVRRRKLELQHRMKNKVRSFFPLSNPLGFRLKMAHKVKNINLSLDAIYKEAINELGLKPVEFISTSVELRETRQTHPYVDDSKIVGRDDDVSKVVEMLLGSNNDEDLPVITVLGMAGLGKTTLAQLVYKDKEVVKKFGKEKMWVCVSEDFKVERLLHEMVESLTGTKCEMTNIDGMIKNLRNMLNAKKYLLVLDDVWNQNMEEWDKMKNALLGIYGDKGSKILVTTRSEEVVSTIQTSLTHHLVQLSHDDSWTMFQKGAFASGGPIETPNLVDVGQRIVRRCRGVPLAIKTLGCLMYSKKHYPEWLSIQDNEIWNSFENNNDMLPSLMLSFDHLPLQSLKQCFAYCSIFRKDHIIVRNDVIHLWMAQGYLQPPQGSNLLMEDVGDSYFNLLLWNSLLEVVHKDEYDNVTSCKMHDLVHNLALHVSKDNYLNLKVSEVTDVPEVLHLSLISEDEDVISIPKQSAQRLRTLYLPFNLLTDMLGDFRGLRALLLIDYRIENLPKSIGKLKHLRYLDLSRTRIKSLPDSFCKLYNLQTFRILRCRKLNELPKEFQKLVSLRHLYVDDNEVSRNLMPMGIGQLTNLQTLPFYVVGQDDGHRIEELECLSSLKGELKIYNLQNVRNTTEAQKARLSKKPNISKLVFNWKRGISEESNKYEDVLEGLQPHKNLKSLTVENFEGERFASWMMMATLTPLLCCLVEIKLKNCNRCKQLPALGHLPCLKVVEIDGGLNDVKCIGAEFYGHICHDAAVFPSLRELILRNMPSLVEWLEAVHLSPGVTIFPCLEKLTIKDCPGLATAPGHFPSVKVMRIENLFSSLAMVRMSKSMTTLEELVIDNVSGLELNSVLEIMLVNNRILQQLSITNCGELSCLPDGLQNLASLSKVSLEQCPNLTCLPNGLHLPVSVQSLYIDSCPVLAVAKPSPHKPLSLRELDLSGFKTLTTDWARWLLSLTELRRLKLGKFSEEYDDFPWPAAAEEKEEEDDDDITPKHLQYPLVSLEILSLYGQDQVRSLPEQLQHLTALKELELIEFYGLRSLPEWLGNLSSLHSLSILGWTNLMNLPSAFQGLTNLRSLTIEYGSMVREVCKKGSGSDWHKIAHIPSITIDFEKIQFPEH